MSSLSNDALRYRIADEPSPGPLQRFALPPLLIFLAGNFFLPWGWLLIGANALALNGPHRNREIAFSVIAVGVYYAGLVALNLMLDMRLFSVDTASYLFVLVIGGGFLFIAGAYVSQERTSQLRTYLNSP